MQKKKKDHRKVEYHEIDKRTFKICEAVALGLEHFYMKVWTPSTITEAERKMALETIPKLPSGWMQMKHRWDAQKR